MTPAGVNVQHADKLWIGGQWVAAHSGTRIDLVDPNTEEIIGSVAEADADDMDAAVAAARAAFDAGAWPRLRPAERIDILKRIAQHLHGRTAELARAWTLQMGGLVSFAEPMTVGSTLVFEQIIAAAENFAFVEARPAELTWHFSRADATLGQSQAQTLAALLRDAADFLGYDVTITPSVVEVRAAGLSLHRTVQKVIQVNQAHRVVFVGAGDSAIRNALRAADILIDFSVETPTDPRRSRNLIRELADSLVQVPRDAFQVPVRLRNTSGYAPAGLSAVVASSVTPSPAAAPVQE